MLPASDPRSGAPRRGQIDRIGSRVLEELVELIVTGSIADGEYLPPEQALCDEFGVSRTVIRECIKRIQEKGLVEVAQGRGTRVRHFNDWNVLDPLVFDSLVRHDESLGVLDEVSVVRAALEGVMASEVAATGSAESHEQIRVHLHDMRRLQHDNPAFLRADMQFHLSMMSASKNRIAATIARSFFVRPLQSARWDGNNPADAIPRTLAEHERVFEAIEAGNAVAARVAMEEHILGSWRRRRLPDGVHHLSP
ncbi:FadR/GntR family transcriptional regulator [Microbacterium sp. Kw_RZR3]|uniref:FadR/GntR family transcriptional regulator n=1 Tax=Microbacterium sp. Kw_RZR3 TaxID=3032903 RepID=UPI0023DBEB96|nr:FadR/GntR family transcriptional regulator [Microbacterium sp. Kw_RZR3]MDF2044894.1 FadR/GntR family transcriptional regulator [Microbacterium sp. Kw_RZR3]